MEKLIQSTDPLLSMAGAIFLIGIAFDLIFSEKFKNELKTLIATSPADSGKRLISSYSAMFVSEILSYGRLASFFVKSMSLSLFFFALISYFELNNVPGAKDLQSRFLMSVVLFVPQTILIVISQLIFDLLSSYVSMLYFSLIPTIRKTRAIILIFISDLVLTAFLWAIFFSAALAVHVKIADLYSRSAEVGVKVQPARGGWKEESFYHRNATLHEKKTRELKVLFYDEPNFVELSQYNTVSVITNIDNDEKLAQQIIATVDKQRSGRLESPPRNVGGNYTVKLSVQNIIDRREFIKLIESNTQVINPIGLILSSMFVADEYQYIATGMIYSYILHSDNRKGQWYVHDDVAIICDDALINVTYDNASTFDFTACRDYVVMPPTMGSFIAQIAGISFKDNYGLSYKACFWSSMAVTCAYYVIFMLIVLLAWIRRVLAKQVVNGVLNLEKGFFTCIFSAVACVFLLLFLARAAVRLLV